MKLSELLPVLLLEPQRLQEVVLGLMKLPENEDVELDNHHVTILAITEWLNHLGLTSSRQDSILRLLPADLTGLVSLVVTDMRYVSYRNHNQNSTATDFLTGESVATIAKPKTHIVCVVANVVDYVKERVRLKVSEDAGV